jgi:hypothetical protein
MRQKLNENKTAQLVLIAVLILGGGFLFMTRMKGSSSSEAPPPAAAASPTAAPADPAAAATGAPVDPTAALTGTATVPAPPLPAPVLAAHQQGDTVVLFVVHDSGIDDRLALEALHALSGQSGVAVFIVPVNDVAKYAAITQGVGLDRTPALIVVRHSDGGPAPASVQYGFQTPESVVQAVLDARYRGPTVTYSPD